MIRNQKEESAVRQPHPRVERASRFRSVSSSAKAAGVSVRAIIKWELGEREPGWFNVVALCEALRVDFRAFHGGAGRSAKRGARLNRKPTGTATGKGIAPALSGDRERCWQRWEQRFAVRQGQPACGAYPPVPGAEHDGRGGTDARTRTGILDSSTATLQAAALEITAAEREILPSGESPREVTPMIRPR